MQPSEIFGVLWRRRWMILLALGLGVAAVLSVGRPATIIGQEYDATATVTVSDGYEPDTAVLYAYVARSTSEITERVSADLGGKLDAQAINTDVMVEPTPEIGTVRVSIEGRSSAEEAGQIVNSYVDHLVGYAREVRVRERDAELANQELRRQSLQAAAEEIQGRITAAGPSIAEGGTAVADRVLDSQLGSTLNSLGETIAEIDRLRFLSEADLTPLRTVGPADVTVNGENSDPLGFAGRMAVGVGLALVLSIGLALVLHRFDTSIYSRTDAEAAFALPVLAEIPRFPRRLRKGFPIVTHTQPTSDGAEAFRLLRSSLSQVRIRQLRQLEEAKQPIPVGTVLLVASANGRDGRSTVVANLAAAFVDAGGKVLVVSGDLRRPTVHRFLGVADEGRGLADVVVRPLPDEDLTELFRPTDVPGVSLLLHGAPVQNPGETLAASVELFELARQHFDLVIVDTPPIVEGNDVAETVPLADLVLLVARAEETAIEDGQLTQKLLSHLDVPACGVVLVGAKGEVARRNARRRHGLKGRLRPQDRSRSIPAAAEPVPVGSGPSTIELGPSSPEGPKHAPGGDPSPAPAAGGPSEPTAAPPADAPTPVGAGGRRQPNGSSAPSPVPASVLNRTSVQDGPRGR